MRKALGRREKGPGESFLFLPDWKGAAFLFEKQMKVKPLGNVCWWFSFMSQHILNTFPQRSGITISFHVQGHENTPKISLKPKQREGGENASLTTKWSCEQAHVQQLKAPQLCRESQKTGLLSLLPSPKDPACF